MKKRLLFFFLIFYFLFNGFIFSFLIPPFQKPDEFAHFKKTVSLANFDLSCQKPKQAIKANLEQVINSPQIGLLPFAYNSKMSVSLYRLKPENTIKDLNVEEGCRFKDSFGYLFSVIAYKLFNWLPINGFILFGLMRFFMFCLVCSTLIFLILKAKNQFSKKIILFVLALPMTINQITAFSYDVGHLFFGLVFCLIFFDLVYEKETNFNIFHLVLAFLGFIFSKPLYEGFFLLFFLIPDQSFKKIKIKKLRLWLFLMVILIFRSLSYHQTGVSLAKSNPTIQKQILFEEPLRIFSLLEKTYFNQFAFYIKSSIGILGWLDFELDFFIYLLFLIIFGFLIGFYKKKIKINQQQAVVYFLITIGTFCILLLAEFLYWTEPGADMIHGVQGRYLIILIPYLFLLIIYLLKSVWFFVLIIFFSLFLNLRSVYYRYFDYSVYAGPTKDLNQIKNKFISLNAGQEKVFKVDDQFNGACYGVYLRFKNKKFEAPIRVEVFDKTQKVITYFTPSQVNQYNQTILSEFKKIKFKEPVFVKVINKYSNKKLVILNKVALKCITDSWRL